jgi:hypothetical protein
VRVYRPPALSRLALWVAHRLTPGRVYWAIFISALDYVDDQCEPIDDHHADGSRSLYDGISNIKIENLKRRIWREKLKAKVGDK